MESLAATKTIVKPQTNEYEVWCQDCAYHVAIGPSLVAGTHADSAALARAIAYRKGHASKHPNHYARARMHSCNIDIGGDIERVYLEEVS